MHRTLADWRRQIEAVAKRAVSGTPLETALTADDPDRLEYARAFADDAGHRRVIDAPVLAWVLRLKPWAAPSGQRPDLLLWDALSRGNAADPLALVHPGAGPAAPQCREEGIEVWTEVELAILQALWWHARAEPSGGAVRARAERLARWLMDEIQPDNGTNHAWAVATFAELAAAGDTDAALYAETLLHNCQVTLGRADRFSAVLLLDAQRSLQEIDEAEAP